MDIFSGIWQAIGTVLGYPMHWFYIFFDEVLHFPLPYVFAMFTFALFTTALMFPLAIKQQRSSARTAAMQPLMNEIKKKFAKDQKRQQAEMQKLQEEMGVNPMAGCLPLLIQFPLLFGLVEVIYAPLKYMLHIPAELLTALKEITASEVGIKVTDRLIENNIIEQVKTNFGLFSSIDPKFASDLAKIKSFDMSIGAIDLWSKPSLAAPSWLWLLPLFSIVTMLVSMLIANKMSGAGQSGTPGTGKMTTIIMSVVMGLFMFSYPAGLSLYWGFRNVVNIGQSAILRKIVNPELVKQKVMEEYEEKKRKNKGKVKVIDEKTGREVEKTVSSADLAKTRLQRARELDAERYGDEQFDVPVTAIEYTGATKPVEEKQKKKAQKETFLTGAETEEFDRLGMFEDKPNGKSKKKK